ncbi:Hypothetical predicted protein [Olea europaea subsp. europaea]|uniref:Uncharacterized protein n=1 Tax=Olea europaea subsp. europaea TaxID=158383 RepID=A0A8S0UN84_OLEEU|nr:Hypothetical predicted protein [Olea europaea subsp. europaea]
MGNFRPLHELPFSTSQTDHHPPPRSPNPSITRTPSPSSTTSDDYLTKNLPETTPTNHATIHSFDLINIATTYLSDRGPPQIHSQQGASNTTMGQLQLCSESIDLMEAVCEF